MQLNFERFTRLRGYFDPTISIRKDGVIGISRGALTRFGMEEGEWFAVLFYDRSARVIGILPTTESSEKGAMKVIEHKTKSTTGRESRTASVSARAFFKYYDIALKETRTFKPKWDSRKKMILIDLNDEVTRMEK